MRLVIALVGIAWTILGLLGLVATHKTSIALRNWVKNTKHQTIGLLSLSLGLLLVIAAPAAEETRFVLALGIMACLKGIAIFTSSEKNLKAAIDWCLEAPEIVYKGWASFSLILGIMMLSII